MKKKCLIIVVLMLSMLVSACSKEQDESRKTQETKECYGKLPSHIDTIYCSLQNAEYDFYYDMTSSNNIEFYLISPTKLEKDKMKIEMDTIYKYNYSVEEVTEDFPYYVYQMYNDVDWNKLAELRKGDDLKEFEEYRDSLLDNYENDKVSVPEIHKYKVNVSFNIRTVSDSKMFENQEINKIKVLTENNEKEFEIERIRFINDSKTNIQYEDIEQEVVAITDYKINPGKDGFLPLADQYSFTTNKDIVIKKIYTLSGNKIKDISIDITKDDFSINKEWDGKSNLEIKKGSKVTIKGNIESEEYKKVDFFSTQEYVLLDYMVGKHRYTTKVEYSYVTDINKYEMVACMKDGIDIKEYYSYLDEDK